VPSLVLRAAAAVVLAAGVGSGVAAFSRDFRATFGEAGPTNAPASLAPQIAAIEARVPAGEPLLLIGNTRTEELWYAWLIQRLLYPRHVVLVRFEPVTRAEVAALERRWAIRHGVALARRPPDLGFVEAADLGALPTVEPHVWLGALAAP